MPRRDSPKSGCNCECINDVHPITRPVFLCSRFETIGFQPSVMCADYFLHSLWYRLNSHPSLWVRCMLRTQLWFVQSHRHRHQTWLIAAKSVGYDVHTTKKLAFPFHATGSTKTTWLCTLRISMESNKVGFCSNVRVVPGTIDESSSLLRLEIQTNRTRGQTTPE